MANAVPLRIGLLMDYSSPHMVSLLNALAEREDLLAEVVYCGARAPERRWGSHLGQLPYRILKGTRFLSGGFHISIDLIRTMSAMNVDAWVINTCYGSPNTMIAAWWLERRAIPWVYMNEPPRPRKGLRSAFRIIPLRYVLRRAWGIIGMGEKAVEMYQCLLDGPRPMTSIPYYIPLEEFFQLPIPKAPVNGGSLQFLVCCQMIHRKGLDVLLQACAELQHMDWQLTLVGDGPLRRKLEQEFAHSFPRERVIFKGEIPYEKRHEAFAGHHIFVFPSRWDGWGMVVPEALAAGLPVVATDQVISAHEFIRDGFNGFVIPANDPKALAEKMAYFIRYPVNIHQMAYDGRQGIKEFRPEVGAERLMKFLIDIAAKNNEYRHERPTQKIWGNPLPWKTLTIPDSIPKYAWKGIRHGAKEAVILLGNMLRPNARPKGHRILVYHLVLKEDRKSFEEQMKFLKDHFLTGSIPEIIQAASAEGDNRSYRVAITFDDGFRVLMGDCLEILEKHNLKASFFIPTGFVEFADQPEMAAHFSLKTHYYNFALEPMRPEDLQTLVKIGHEVGSHGISHIGISSMSRQRATRELEWSAQRIRQWTGINPSGFAYPNGHTGSVLGDPIQWIRQAGYDYGLTLRRGKVQTSSNPFLLPREHSEGNWSVHDLRFFLMK